MNVAVDVARSEVVEPIICELERDKRELGETGDHIDFNFIAFDDIPLEFFKIKLEELIR